MAEPQKNAARKQENTAESPALNSLEAEVIGFFVELSRALGHPCKIYNILAVDAPVIYIGPTPSHVTEILNQLGNDYPSIRVNHGQADILVNQIQEMRRKKGDSRSLQKTVPVTYSKDVLLPALIATLEGRPDG